MTARTVASLSLALVAACGSGQGGDSTGDGTGDGGTDAAATPSCMVSLTPAALPKDGSFPTDWPFPRGTVVTSVEKVTGGGVAVTAQIGSDFEKVLPFMQHDLEDAGFVATQGEAEHDDAEATWTGGGYAGSWAIRASDDCEGTTMLQVAAAKQ